MKETTECRHPLLLINRCLILNVLQATKAQSTLSKYVWAEQVTEWVCQWEWLIFIVCFRFMEGGGWNLLNAWLSDGKKSQNIPFILEILQVSSSLSLSLHPFLLSFPPPLSLQVLQRLPVTIVALKQVCGCG